MQKNIIGIDSEAVEEIDMHQQALTSNIQHYISSYMPQIRKIMLEHSNMKSIYNI